MFSRKAERPGSPASAPTVSTGAAASPVPAAGKPAVRTVSTFFASVACTVCSGVAGIDRPLEGVGRDDLDHLGDLHHVEERRNPRQHVLAGRGRRRDDRVVAAGERDDQRRGRLGEPLRERVALGEQHLAHALEPRGRLGGGAGGLAGDEDVDLAADPRRGAQRPGGLIGERGVVVLGEEKDGHVT